MAKITINVIGCYGNAAESGCAAMFDAFSRVIRKWGYDNDDLKLIYTSAQEPAESPRISVSEGEGAQANEIKRWDEVPRFDDLRQYLKDTLGEPEQIEKKELVGSGSKRATFYTDPVALAPWRG